MKAVRRPDGTLPHELKPGEYARADTDSNVYWLCNPEGEPGRISAPTWSIADANSSVGGESTLTVHPSIWWNSPDGWHGFITSGVWTSV